MAHFEVRGCPRARRGPSCRAVAGVALVFALGVTAGWGRLVFAVARRVDRNARESTAIHTLFEIERAQGVFHDHDPAGRLLRYGTLAEIVSAGFLGEDLHGGVRGGFRFHVSPSVTAPQDVWGAVAEPLEPCDRTFLSCRGRLRAVLGPVNLSTRSCEIWGPPRDWPFFPPGRSSALSTAETRRLGMLWDR